MSLGTRRGLITLALALLFVGGAWGLYAPETLDVPFLLDDLAAVPLLHPEGPLDAGRALSVMWPTDSEFAYNQHFRPLGWASVIADDYWFGLHPQALRSVAFVLHGLVAFMICILGRLLWGARAWPAALVAGAWCLLYPGSIEPVVWVAHRFTLLATLFFLVGAIAAVVHARRGGFPVVLVIAATAALASKDSMITEVLALTVLGPAVAAPEHRWVRWLQSSCAVGLALALYFGLRMASLGVAIPAFTAGGTVLETFDPLARLAAAPRCLLLLLAPVGPGGPGAWPRAALVTVMLGGLAVLLLGAALGTRASRRRLVPPAALLSAVLLCGLPVLDVAWDLGGARRLYLPAAALALLVGAAARGAWIWIPVALLATAIPVAHLRNQAAYFSARNVVGEVTRTIEEHAQPGRTVLVTGLPATWSGAPRFGPALEHLRWRFRPPLREPGAEVRGAPPAEMARLLREAAGPVALLIFAKEDATSEGTLEPRPRLAHALRLQGPGECTPTPEMKIIVPRGGAAWPDPPDPSGAWITFEVAGPEVTRALRIVIACEDLHADLVFTIPRGRTPRWLRRPSDDQLRRWSVNVPALPLLVPAESLNALAGRIPGPPTPATLWIEEVPDASAAAAGRRSTAVPFILGAGS